LRLVDEVDECGTARRDGLVHVPYTRDTLGERRENAVKEQRVPVAVNDVDAFVGHDPREPPDGAPETQRLSNSMGWKHVRSDTERLECFHENAGHHAGRDRSVLGRVEAANDVEHHDLLAADDAGKVQEQDGALRHGPAT
jgi:hypothetical protein